MIAVFAKGLHGLGVRDAQNAQKNNYCPHGALPFLIKSDHRFFQDMHYTLNMAPFCPKLGANVEAPPASNRWRVLFLPINQCTKHWLDNVCIRLEASGYIVPIDKIIEEIC